jgi:hypothetical protein
MNNATGQLRDLLTGAWITSGVAAAAELDLTGHPGDEAFTIEVKRVDLAMLTLLGGGERTDAEFRSLLVGAASLCHGVTPTRGSVSLIECRPA